MTTKGSPKEKALETLGKIYVNLLFSVGFGLNFRQVATEDWFRNPLLLLQNWTYVLHFTTLLFCYVTIILSVVGFAYSAEDHKIESEARFFVTTAILMIYFVFLLKYNDLFSEMILLATSFGLFILWDVLKEREFSSKLPGDDLLKMKRRSAVTRLWFVVSATAAIMYYLLQHNSWAPWLFVLISFTIVVAYRYNKNHYNIWPIVHPERTFLNSLRKALFKVSRTVPALLVVCTIFALLSLLPFYWGNLDLKTASTLPTAEFLISTGYVFAFGSIATGLIALTEHKSAKRMEEIRKLCGNN